MAQSRRTLHEFGKVSIDKNTMVVESLTVATTLDNEDSGKIFMLNLAAGFTVTLPAPEDAPSGWNATFVVGTSPTGNYVITSGSADILAVGSTNQDAGGDGPSSAGTKDTNINFIASQSLVGDRVFIFTDGTSYYANYQVDEVNHITLT